MIILMVLFLIIALYGWIKNKMGLMTLTYYMERKGYAQPSDEEIRICTEWVVRNMCRRN